MARKSDTPKFAPVDDYPERPLSDALMDPDEIAAYENRATEDQIVDYHKDNPTLKAGKAQNAEPPTVDLGDPVV